MAIVGAARTSFWIVWSPGGAQPPQFRHPSPGAARGEAHRLAQENPGTEFFVLEPKARYVLPRSAMLVTRYSDDDDGVPF